MKKLSISILALFLGLSLLVDASDSSWQKLKTKAVTEGVPSETDFGTYKTLTHKISRLPLGSYHIDYFSAVGSEFEGVFYASHFDAVSETWIRQENGDWNIHQWLYRLNDEGEMSYIAQYEIQKSIDGFLIHHDFIPFTDEEADDSFKEYLVRWTSELKIQNTKSLRPVH